MSLAHYKFAQSLNMIHMVYRNNSTNKLGIEDDHISIVLLRNGVEDGSDYGVSSKSS